MKMTAEMIDKMSPETIARIKQIVDDMDLRRTYEYVGFRVQEQEFELGKIDHVSHVWYDGEDTGVELDGICVCDIDDLGASRYYGEHAAIICGYYAEWGEDPGERVIRDAEVVKIIC